MPLHNIFKKTKKSANPKLTKLKATADIHEKNSLVVAELSDLGVNAEFKHLKVADYLIGEVAIERKTISDFISSMINKRLLKQLEELKQYEKRLLIVEGIEEQEFYNDKPEGMHGNAIRGMLLHTILEANCPIIFSKNYKDTARFLFLIAKRMEKDKKEISLYGKKKSLNFKQQKQYILEAFPNIGPATAKKLLKKFKTINNIINAKEKELQEILKNRTESFKGLLQE